MNQKFNVATLVISSSTYPSERNVRAQKKIFFDQELSGEHIYWYKQGSSEQLNGERYKLINNDLYLDVPDDTLNMGRKTLLAFEWLNKNVEYDYVVRPTPSSYINFKNLNEYILNHYIDKEVVYGGKIQQTNDKYGSPIYFASGSSLILNKNCVDLILENQHSWDHDYWDDVGLAVLLNELDIKPTGGDRFDIHGNPYKQQIDLGYYQYRCRSDNHYGYPRLIESHVLKYVHNLFSSKKKHIVIRKIGSFIIEFLGFIYIYQFGWKIYSFLRKITKIILPKSIYKYLKNKLFLRISSFKHKRFKT